MFHSVLLWFVQFKAQSCQSFYFIFYWWRQTAEQKQKGEHRTPASPSLTRFLNSSVEHMNQYRGIWGFCPRPRSSLPPARCLYIEPPCGRFLEVEPPAATPPTASGCSLWKTNPNWVRGGRLNWNYSEKQSTFTFFLFWKKKLKMIKWLRYSRINAFCNRSHDEEDSLRHLPGRVPFFQRRI